MLRRTRTLLLVVGLATTATIAMASGTPAWAWFGSLDVSKQVVLEPGATVPPGATFTVVVSCTLDNQSTGTWHLVFDSTGALVPGSSDTTLPIGNIPQGSTCTAQETATGGANTVVVSPAVTITQDQTADITVTNTFTAPATTTASVAPAVVVSPAVVTRAPAAVAAAAVVIAPAFTG
jgi:Domain of unknown function (DUF5979)